MVLEPQLFTNHLIASHTMNPYSKIPLPPHSSLQQQSLFLHYYSPPSIKNLPDPPLPTSTTPESCYYVPHLWYLSYLNFAGKGGAQGYASLRDLCVHS